MRLFHEQTGMSFTQWRTRLLLVEAVERLVAGASVTDVAVDLGYGSTSSFVYMFRSNLGVSPGRYRANPPNKGEPRATSPTRGRR
jgi:AraC-like DNA-binding protein